MQGVGGARLTHLLGRHDRELHYDNGEHRGTPPTTDGAELARYEAKIRRHLAEHERETLRAHAAGMLGVSAMIREREGNAQLR